MIGYNLFARRRSLRRRQGAAGEPRTFGSAIAAVKVGSAALCALTLSGCVSEPAPAYVVKGPIEAKYQVKGPWAVSETVSAKPCDRKNHLCDIWYPTNLGTNPILRLRRGFKHPVISWANGTGQTPAVYGYYLQHLASWGFIVVAARDESAGNGDTTADAADYIVRQAKSPSSIFWDRVDFANFGAVGHSQGGAAVTSLHAHNSPLFKTFIGFHTSPGWFARHCCDVSPTSYQGADSAKPIFQWSSTPDSGRPDWYDPVPAKAQKAYALLKYTHHGDIAGSPGCRDAGCAQGAYGYLGYSTAWLMWQLQGAADAGAAFRQGGEFFRPNPGWSMNLSNIP